MIIFLIWIPVILIFYLKNWVQINTKCYCLSSRVFLESLILLFCRPNNQKSLTQKDGENDFLLQFIQYKASLSLDFLHEKFLDQEVLMELAVIEWAAKWKLFNPFFFSLIRGEVLFILYLCSLCRFIKERCFPLYIVIPLMCFDFSRCIWNCQPLGFLLLYLDKVGLREVSFFFFFFLRATRSF